MTAPDDGVVAAPATPPPPMSRKGIAAGLVILGCGLVLIAAAAVMEVRILDDAPLSDAALFIAPENPWDAGLSLRLRETEGPDTGPSPFRAALDQSPDGRDFAEQLRLDQHELIALANAEGLPWDEMLVAGRLPEQGKPEVLGGALVRADQFTLDGETFTVVGEIHPAASGFDFVYLLPADERWDPLFAPEQGGSQAWLVDDGLARLKDEGLPETLQERDDVRVLGGQQLAPGHTASTTLAGLVLVALGGAIAQVVWLIRRKREGKGIFQPAIHAMANHGKVLIAVHVILYGLFFASMVVAALNPLANMRLGYLVSGEFQEGSLSYIGDAYASGNVLRAAFMTWIFNFGVATVSLSALPSFILPGWALLKNALTFTMVGFVMSPIWLPSAGGMIYHSITMTLELQAYVYVSFGAVMFPYYFVRGLSTPEMGTYAMRGARILVSTVGIAGVLLAVAALYEAATLIAFRI
jgi:hypothetical protein